MIEPKDIITGLFYIFTSALVALIGAWALLKRVRSQNMKDDIGTAAEAMKMAGEAIKQNHELSTRIQLLESIMNSGKYQLTLVARLGETPEIKSAIIEKV